MTKYVIINADDFGLSAGVNQGIIEAHEAGVISSASVITNMPGCKGALAYARRTPTFGVGLHVNLTDGRPLSPPHTVPSLVYPENGLFHSRYETWKSEDIERELQAQWQAFRSAGLKPTHIDSHTHIHLLYPAVFQAVAKLALREMVPIRYRPDQALLADSTIAIRSTDRLILDTYHEPDGTKRFYRYLQWLEDGTTEIMCHPGYVDEEMQRHTRWTKERELELHHLMHSDIRCVLQVYNIRLIHYGQLPESSTFHTPSLPLEAPPESSGIQPEEIPPSPLLAHPHTAPDDTRSPRSKPKRAIRKRKKSHTPKKRLGTRKRRFSSKKAM
ncbi:hypothetical protein BVG16_20810 [Paenibacillus selenitireducens]|uniref:Carbohydrate deacetylase n=1 Tax=Paenibacillus selenitireducens TaxID=1324314 RepID=A0A1T2X7F3_9BACL|nr:ChbG/HpnK family deacetylase [Paenibacillus selenitireducens]OPA75772.1 hypothetical protein BVG16_20810 [Paenibacillus selenitireducens]